MQSYVGRNMWQNVLQKYLKSGLKLYSGIFIHRFNAWQNCYLLSKEKENKKRQPKTTTKKPQTKNYIHIYIYKLFVLCLCLNKINKKMKEIGTVKK